MVPCQKEDISEDKPLEKGMIAAEADSRIRMESLFTANVLAPLHLVTSRTTSFSLLASFVLLATLTIIVRSRFGKERGNIPDTTYGSPVVGSLLAYSKNPVSYLRKAAAQYGKVFRTNMIFTSVVWLRDPNYNRFYLEVKEVGFLSIFQRTLLTKEWI